MKNPKSQDNPWLIALYISGAGGLLAAYILIGFYRAMAHESIGRAQSVACHWYAFGALCRDFEYRSSH